MTDQTRRTWLIERPWSLYIFQRHVARALVPAVSTLVSRPSDPIALPPGVYEASAGDLGHALMSAQRYHPIPPGCPTGYLRPANAPFEPRFFSKSEFPLLRRLTQLLLGEDSEDSPIISEVAEWIDLRVASAAGALLAEARLDPLHRALADAYFGSSRSPAANENAGDVCREGMASIRSRALTTYSKDFLSLAMEQQIAILDSASDTRFFSFLKAEIVRGFYTSETGLRELDFKGNAFYARSPGCPT